MGLDRLAAPLCALLMGCGGGGSTAVVWHDDGTPPAGRAMSSPRRAQGAEPALPPQRASLGPAGAPEKRNGRRRISELEVFVHADRLDVGWTGEPSERACARPVSGTDAPRALRRAAEAYAKRERAAASGQQDRAFEGRAALRIGGGVDLRFGELRSILATLDSAGFHSWAVHDREAPVPLELPLEIRPPDAGAPVPGVLGYVTLQWRGGDLGSWMAARAAWSTPERGATAAPVRPDLAIPLRSAWSCGVVAPERSFEDALRRGLSALRTYDFGPELPVLLAADDSTPLIELRLLGGAGNNRDAVGARATLERPGSGYLRSAQVRSKSGYLRSAQVRSKFPRANACSISSGSSRSPSSARASSIASAKESQPSSSPAGFG